MLVTIIQVGFLLLSVVMSSGWLSLLLVLGAGGAVAILAFAAASQAEDGPATQGQAIVLDSGVGLSSLSGARSSPALRATRVDPAVALRAS